MAPESNILDKILDYFEPKFLMGHFAPAETKGNLDLHIVAKKVDRMTQFDPEIVRIDGGAQLHFLHLIGVLMLLSIFVLLSLLVPELAKIDKTAYRWSGIGSDLDKVDSLRASHIDRFAEGDDSKLLATRAYDAYLTRTDLAVNSNKRVGRSLTRSERATQDTLFG